MKAFLLIVTSLVAFSSYAAQSKLDDAKILSISMRTVEYTAGKYADMALVKLNKSFTSKAEGCVKNEIYLHPNKDKAIFSALLTAKTQGLSLNFYIDASMTRIDNWCKLVAIEF